MADNIIEPTALYCVEHRRSAARLRDTLQATNYKMRLLGTDILECV